MYALVINVPGSQLKPGLTRREAIESEVRSTFGDLKLNFLSNIWTPAKVLADEQMNACARMHDTFVPPPLRKAILGVGADVALTEEQKAKATHLANVKIYLDWLVLTKELTRLDFACRDLDRLQPPSGMSAKVWSCWLDATRTKLTRTACTKSHEEAYRELEARSESVALLLEDDLVMLPELPAQIERILAWLELNDQDWNLVQLGYSKHEERPIEAIADSPLGRAPRGAYGNTALLVNLANKTPRRVIDLLESHRASAAASLANDVVIAESNLRVYQAMPRLVGPPYGDHLSLLAGAAMNYNTYCWDPEQLAILKAKE